jgi:hypothetical protein
MPKIIHFATLCTLALKCDGVLFLGSEIQEYLKAL